MEFLAKVLNGHLADNAPFNTLQICYLQYVDKRKCCSGARMTKLYNMKMPKIQILLDDAIKRYSTSKPLADTSSIEHEIWQCDIFHRTLGKSAPYDSSNINELTVYEWKHQSSVREAFIFNKIRFDLVTVIIENNMEHWFGIKSSSNPVYTYHRSRPRPRTLMTVECCKLPQSPIVLAANNPTHKSKCADCGECNQIVMPMETYYLKKTCRNPTNNENEIDAAEECTEFDKPEYSCKNIFKC